MLALRLDAELDAKIAALARARSRSKSEIVREAILRLIEDEEDLALVERARRGTRKAKSLRQLRQELGLDG